MNGLNSQYNIMVLAAILIMFPFTGCSGGDDSRQQENATQQTSGLNDFQLEHGIGPIQEPVELGEFDQELAAHGKEVFEQKCSACHKPTERYIGPAVGDVLDRRTPAYVMNMIMNPDEMTKKHPEARKLLQEYMSPMPYQNVSREQARAIVEYFRSIEM